MTFKRLSQLFDELEKTTLRNKMVELLSSLFKEASKDEIGHLCYLLQGRVVPTYEKIEFGVADKMILRAIAQGLDVDIKRVEEEFKILGDLGIVVEKLKLEIACRPARQGNCLPAGEAGKLEINKKQLSINDVYNILYKVATVGGEGSQEIKVKLLADLIAGSDPLSTRFIVRIPLDKLRLGFSDMTILDSLSWMLKGTKELRPEIERAYNVRPDLGFIATTIKEKGVEGLKYIIPKIGTPIMMARADRLASSKEILEKIGRCAVEFKYDGLRLQVHYQKTDNRKQITDKKEQKKSFIRMFSRNLEDVTGMFPDIAAALTKQIKADEMIFEGEVVAFNPQTHVFVPFQQTMQRKRKYDIDQKAKEIPVKLFAFELLCLNGENLIKEPFSRRKELLKKHIREGETIIYAPEVIVSEESEIDRMFDDSMEKGFEGIIAKRLDGVYQAGMRGFNWIKFKRAMNKKLMDTFDVLVMGYTRGEGKRTVFGVGQFLAGVYDASADAFVSLTKVGTGLTDEEFRELKTRADKLEVKDKPKSYNVDKLLAADIWLRPALVVEIGADEITRSQAHTAGRVMEVSKSGNALSVKEAGYALRFPKLVRFRDDKSPSEATTVTEIKKMFERQGSKVI